jgi:PKD repeat protein
MKLRNRLPDTSSFLFLNRAGVRGFLFLLSFCSIILAGCLGGGGGEDGGSASSASVSSSGGGVQGIQIMGTGLDGPLSYGMIDFYNSDGSHCEATATDENSFYEIIISPSCTFPLKVELTEGVDASSNLTNPTTLYSLVYDQYVSTININAFTTLIYYAALERTSDRSLQSLRRENINIDAITQEITRKFNFGIDAEADDFNPLKTPVTTGNVVSLVKANEGLMEGIRRTAKSASTNGEANASSINQILSALGADISDGLLDGRISNFNPRAYEVLNLSGAQLVGIWEANALDVALELMTNRLAISLTEEQKILQAAHLAIPLGDVPPMITPDQVANNLGLAIEEMVDNLGGFITSEEALQRLEHLGMTAKFLNQTQAALKFQLAVALAKGLNPDTLNTIQAQLGEMARAMNSSGELDFAQLQSRLGETYTDAVSKAIKDGSIAPDTMETAASDARLELNTSEPLTRNVRKLVAAWDYGDTSPEKFRLYEISDRTAKMLCEIPGNLRTSALIDCYSNMNETPKEFYLTAYASGMESAPSPTISYNNRMPAAMFQASFTAGQVPLEVDFNGSDSYDPDGEIRLFIWDFGDGTQATGQKVSHTFTRQGNYSVLLKVWDDYAVTTSDSASALAVLNITVGGEPNTLAEEINFAGAVRAIDHDRFAAAKPLPEKLTSSAMSSPAADTAAEERTSARLALTVQHESHKVDLLADQPLQIMKPETNGLDESDWRSSLHAFLAEWLKAWEKTAGGTGDIINYGNMYSARFYSGKFDKEAWLKDKIRKNSRKEWIELKLKDIEITRDDNGLIRVKFCQEYDSSNYADSSEKEILVIKEAGQLKILNETTL